MPFAKQQFMEERQKESETKKYSAETIKYHREYAANLRDQATKVNNKYSAARLILIAERIEDFQPISHNDRKFLKEY